MKLKFGSRLPMAILFVLIVAVSALIAGQLFNPYKYSSVADGVEFLSSGREPLEQLAVLAEKRLFVVSPELFESGTANSYMATSLTLFNTVLRSNNRTAVTVARIISPEKQLLYCQTNEGDASRNLRIEAEECNGWLSRQDYVQVLVSMPSPSLPRPRAIVFESSISIQPNSFEAVSPASLAVLRQMFANTDAAIATVNSALGRLGSQ